MKLKRIFLLFTLIFALCLSATGGAQASNAAFTPTNYEAMFGVAVDASGEAWSNAVTVRFGNRVLVYTSSQGAEDSAKKGSRLKFDGKSYALLEQEGKVFQSGDLFAWRTESGVDSPHVLSCACPTLKEVVTVAYFSEEGSLLTDRRQISDSKVFEDGTGNIFLDSPLSDMQSPGILLNLAGNCVGILFHPNIAYAVWYDDATFRGESAGEETGGAGSQEANPDTSGTDLPPLPPEPWWTTTGGAVKIVAAVAGLAGVVAFLARKKRKKSDDVSNDAASPPAPPPVSPASPPAPPASPPVSPAPPPSQKLGLVFTGGELNGAYFPISEGVITIGRRPDCTIRYPAHSKGISREHAKIYCQNGRITLLDTSSTGTFLNSMDARLSPDHSVQLQAGDVFFLGSESNKALLVRE